MGTVVRIALLFAVLLAGGCPNRDGPHCKKGKRCGNGCIDHDKMCTLFPAYDGTAGSGF